MKKILSNKLWMRVLCADMISNFGDVLFYFALMNYILLLPDAKFAISLVTLSETIPPLLAAFIGYIADRSRHKIQKIIATQLFRAMLYGVVGILFGVNPSLVVVLIVIGINFFSDLAGAFENSLYVPVSVKLIDNDSREQSIGFRQTVTQVLSIVFQSISAILVVMLSYQQLAFLNATTFVVSAIIMFSIRFSLKQLISSDDTIQKSVKNEEKSSFIKSFKTNGKLAIDALKTEPELLIILGLSPILNALFVVLKPLMLLTINVNASFVIENAPTTIAISAILETVFSIVGSILAMTILKKWTVSQSAIAIMLAGCSCMIGLFVMNSYWYLISLAFMCLFASALQPKLSSRTMNAMPQDNIALIFGFIGSYATSGMLLMSTIFSILVAVLPLKLITIIYLVLMIGVTVFLVLKTKSFQKSEIVTH